MCNIEMNPNRTDIMVRLVWKCSKDGVAGVRFSFGMLFSLCFLSMPNELSGILQSESDTIQRRMMDWNGAGIVGNLLMVI